jgi:hypothetical protein
VNWQASPSVSVRQSLKCGSRDKSSVGSESEFELEISVLLEDRVMRIAMIILALMMFSASASAECYTNARGRYVCGNGQEAGAITPIPATPGSQRRTRMGSRRRRRAREEKPRPKMVRAFIRALMAKTVTRQHITTAVVEMIWQDSGRSS